MSLSLFRMTANSTQPSHPPLKLSEMNTEEDFDIHPPLPVNTTADSQPSSISFNQSDMISSAPTGDSRVRNNAEQMNEWTTEQHTLPTHDTEAFERRQREWRRRQQQRRTPFEQRRRQQNEQPQNTPVCHRSPPRYDDQHFGMMNWDPLEEPMDEMYNKPLLDVYHYETMNPQARQEAWDQEHLQEMQGLSVPRYFAAQPNSLERYAMALELQLQRDQHEQVMSIYEMQNGDYFQRCQRNHEQLMDKREWEDIAFRLKQHR